MPRAYRPRDAMRARCYEWDTDLVYPRDTAILTREQCDRLVETVWRCWMEAAGRIHLAPVVRYPARKLDGACAWSHARIDFSASSMKTWVVAHEVAHCVTSLLIGDMREAGHGPTWRVIYAHTLAGIGIMPSATIARTLHRYGLLNTRKGKGFVLPDVPGVNLHRLYLLLNANIGYQASTGAYLRPVVSTNIPKLKEAA